jgi:hypothetical protein
VREINHLSLHQWLRSAIPDSQQPTSPIGFLFLKLPPPPCAVLLVIITTMQAKEGKIWVFHGGFVLVLLIFYVPSSPKYVPIKSDTLAKGHSRHGQKGIEELF